MTNPHDWRETRSPEDAAADTEEPPEATRVRVEDDAETKARQAETEAGLQAADRALDEGEARLRETRSALSEREQELERTSHLTREVAKNAAELRDQTKRMAEQARKPVRRADDVNA